METLYTVKECAKVLRTGRTMIYHLMKEKELGFVLVGKSRRIRQSDIDAYLGRKNVK